MGWTSTHTLATTPVLVPFPRATSRAPISKKKDAHITLHCIRFSMDCIIVPCTQKGANHDLLRQSGEHLICGRVRGETASVRHHLKTDAAHPPRGRVSLTNQPSQLSCEQYDRQKEIVFEAEKKKRAHQDVKGSDSRSPTVRTAMITLPCHATP